MQTEPQSELKYLSPNDDDSSEAINPNNINVGNAVQFDEHDDESGSD